MGKGRRKDAIIALMLKRQEKHHSSNSPAIEQPEVKGVVDFPTTRNLLASMDPS